MLEHPNTPRRCDPPRLGERGAQPEAHPLASAKARLPNPGRHGTLKPERCLALSRERIGPASLSRRGDHGRQTGLGASLARPDRACRRRRYNLPVTD